MPNAPAFNLAAVEAATTAGVAAGHRVFQTHKYAATDAEHVAYLLEILAPPPGALVLDNGCGIGEVPRLMHQTRPDLRFVLVNLSEMQLGMCPQGRQFIPLVCDSHRLDLPANCVDAVMFSSSLCQMDEARALAEAYRVLVPGGTLLVNEPTRVSGDGQALEQALACRTLTFNEMLAAIEHAGFKVNLHLRPVGSSEHMRRLMGEGAHMMDNVEPLIVKAAKGLL